MRYIATAIIEVLPNVYNEEVYEFFADDYAEMLEIKQIVKDVIYKKFNQFAPNCVICDMNIEEMK